MLTLRLGRDQTRYTGTLGSSEPEAIDAIPPLTEAWPAVKQRSVTMRVRLATGSSKVLLWRLLSGYGIEVVTSIWVALSRRVQVRCEETRRLLMVMNLTRKSTALDKELKAHEASRTGSMKK
jgi:hypothetical protein